MYEPLGKSIARTAKVDWDRMPRNEEEEEALEQSTPDFSFATLLPYSHSMDLSNDPRFFASNVVEKRLAAFSGLSVIASLTTGTALKQCFTLSKNFNFARIDGYVQVTGFLSMACVLFMSLTATLVFVYQAFFTHRLVTAGPTGFELAKEFYLHQDVVKWRHFAVRCLGIGLPTVLFASGCMLYVKLVTEGQSLQYKGIRYHPLALSTLLVFTVGSVLLFHIEKRHSDLFGQLYERRDRFPHERGEPLIGYSRESSRSRRR